VSHQKKSAKLVCFPNGLCRCEKYCPATINAGSPNGFQIADFDQSLWQKGSIFYPPVLRLLLFSRRLKISDAAPGNSLPLIE
jgi:hypothetical protein